MKFLKYRSENTKHHGNIQVDTSEYKEIKELEHLIMSNSHLDEDQYFIVFDQHQEKLIEKIKYDSEIKISVYRYLYLYFQFPNLKSPIKLNSPFENTFQDIIVIFKKNNIYLSYDFINNMKMFCNGKELKKDGKPFHGLKYDSFIKIECITKTVNLYYGYKKFIFCENELASVPKNFIGSQYKGCETVKIKVKNNKKILDDNDRLKSNAQYEVKILYKITFRKKSSGIQTVQMLDFLATIKDAQKKIAKVFSTQTLRINPEDVILSNADQQITRYSATSPLIAQNPKHEFYFEIKIGAKNSILNPIPQNNKKDHQHQHDQKHQDNYIHNSGNKLHPDDKNYAVRLFNKEPSHVLDKLKKAQDDRLAEQNKDKDGNYKPKESYDKKNAGSNDHVKSKNKEDQDNRRHKSNQYKKNANKVSLNDYSSDDETKQFKKKEAPKDRKKQTKEESENQDSKDKKTKRTIKKYKPTKLKENESESENEKEEIAYEKENEKEKEGNEFEEEEETSLKIVFIVKKIGEEGSNLLKRTLPLETTISDIKEIICDKYEIEEDTLIDIKYKQKEGETTVSRDMTIEDIKHKMRNEQNKDYSYTLYVYINQPTSKNTKNTNSTSSDDDDESEPVKKSKNKKVKKQQSDDDDDDDELDFKKPSKQKVDPIRRNKNESSDEDDSSIKNQRNQRNKNERQNKKRKHHGSSEDNENDDDDDDEFQPLRKSKPKNQKQKRNESSSENDDDDDESSEDKKRPQKVKPKNQKARPSKSSDDDDDDESSEDKKRPQKVKPKNKNKKARHSKSSDDDDDEDEEFQPLRKSKPKNQKQKRNESSSENDTADDDDDDDDDNRGLRVHTYRYQVNRETKLYTIELDSNATVKTMKKKIAKLRKIKSSNRVKIIFAGKELLNDISLESLEIGDDKLFVYAQEIDEIFVHTAKALRLDRNPSVNELNE